MRSCWRRRDCCESCRLPVASCQRWRAGRRATGDRQRIMIVIKFGGTSVGDAQRVANAIDIVAERRERDPIVVVSALAGVTNDLVAATEAACAGDAERVNDIIDRVRLRHEDVAMRLVQQKFDFFEAFLKKLHRSEEHTSELQSQSNLVCRLLLEKKKKKTSH